MDSSSDSESDVLMAEADQSLIDTARALFPNKIGLKHSNSFFFFFYDSKTKESSCNMCTRTVSGRNTTILEAHLKARDLLKEFIELEKLKRSEAKSISIRSPLLAYIQCKFLCSCHIKYISCIL